MKTLIDLFMILSGWFFLLNILWIINLNDDPVYTTPNMVNDVVHPPKDIKPIKNDPEIALPKIDNRCPSWGCYFKWNCITPVPNSSCVSFSSTDAWKCNSWYLEINWACTKNRPYNWQILSQNYWYLWWSWEHEITIKNNWWWSDSLVKIVPVWWRSVIDFYVRKWSSYTVKSIPNWTYDIYFKHYESWINWLMSKWAQKMEDPVSLYTSYEWNRVYSSTYEVTLYWVIWWDVQTDYVWSDSFDDL